MYLYNFVLDTKDKKMGANGSKKATSVYLTVSDRATHKTLLHKVFFNAKDMNKFTETDEFKEKYPTTEVYLSKEVY